MTDRKLNKFEKLQRLQNKYIAELPDKITMLQLQWKQLQAAGDEHVLKEFSRSVHNLAGSAGTFGFSSLSDQARNLEKLLIDLQGQPEIDKDSNEKISSALFEIEQSAERGSDFTYSPDESISQQPTSVALTEQLVYMVEDDPIIAEEIHKQLLHFGYEVKVFPNLGLAQEASKEMLPSALIIDGFLPDGDLKGFQFINDSSVLSSLDVPVIFVSTRDDWGARLAAVRSGGDAYLKKPIDYGELLDLLEELIAGKELEPCRILIVDDMQVLAEHYALVLRAADMHVKVLTDPSGLFEVLKEFKPELILMDIDMPVCSGLEAAKIIRQNNNLTGIPIIFLSTESSQHQQDAAMKVGADDFLQKPISDSRLVTSVTLRVERFRKLRSQMSHDSLTGLLNHVTIKLQLEGEVARAIRQNNPLVFAMVDIDEFKRVNDQYGHPVGDRVIKSLSRLFMQRLRKSDLVGRYGGEEFALVLPYTKQSDACTILEALRKQFEAIVHTLGEQQFSCTFSAGLALLKNDDDTNRLIFRADQALYQAKKAGRNQIICAQ